jgi:hypothetical protein
MRILRYFVIMALALANSPVYAETLQPTSKWLVDYAPTMCTASRTYGSENDPIYFGIIPSPSGDVVRFLISRKGKVGDAHHFSLHLRFSGQQIRTTGLRFDAPNTENQIVWITVNRNKLSDLEKASEFDIEGVNIDDHFAVPDIQAVLKELDKCGRDLRDFWNVNSGVIASTATPVKPLRKYFSDMDYPDQALEEGLGGRTVMVMLIDEKGALKDCMIEVASGIATIDAMGCLVLRARAKFNPALDKQGKPVRSILMTSIQWVAG